jgi:hypothetical protein
VDTRDPELAFLVIRRAALILGLALGVPVCAQDHPRVWLNPGFYSLHFDREKDLRDDNIGLGAEVVLAEEHVLAAGTFINSNRLRSRFAGYAWRPLGWKVAGLDVRAGVVVAAFDGYPGYDDGGWFIAPLPLLAIEGRWLGANFSIVPPIAGWVDGAFVMQVKLRVW